MTIMVHYDNDVKCDTWNLTKVLTLTRNNIKYFKIQFYWMGQTSFTRDEKYRASEMVHLPLLVLRRTFPVPSIR